ncbi:TetR family transcriptional regulator [Streptomyces glebosus]|uniref:TetR family transcriptional regulator n=1 Tax=Streptomyces glebosus TaxID=249580 RepID=A0A640SUM5_9ACTN|nr:helix-turn-helix domain-containing protein [Streptomyces glebosus]GFE15123.1 TetR family transcriptional regulator [Streptomyces glebosus]GHG88854.1 TetR family transcriptional regulator [Streptomyces glebosus]
MIVAAALPLVAEYGAAVTTSQIARAAGIGEGTIFRAFKDKDELLDACVTEAVGTDHVLRALASISLDEPLPARLAEAAEALHAHLERMGTVVGALHASGHRRSRGPGIGSRGGETAPRDGRGGEAAPPDGRDGELPPPDGRDGQAPPPDSRTQSLAALRNAVIELLEPDRAAFRLSPEKVAAAFLGLLFTRLQAPASAPEADALPLTPDELIAILLHGTLNAPGSA